MNLEEDEIASALNNLCLADGLNDFPRPILFYNFYFATTGSRLILFFLYTKI